MASMSFAIVIFTLCLATGLEASTSYTSCSPAKDPIDFRMDGCTEPPCILYQGDVAKAEWDFEVTADTKTLKPRVKAFLGPIGIPYNIGQKNACETLTNAECPLDKGEEVTYGLKMSILSIFPAIAVPIEFALLGSDNTVHVCFQVSVQIAKPKST